MKRDVAIRENLDYSEQLPSRIYYPTFNNEFNSIKKL